jgi:hypothetical protein
MLLSKDNILNILLEVLNKIKVKRLRGLFHPVYPLVRQILSNNLSRIL